MYNFKNTETPWFVETSLQSTAQILRVSNQRLAGISVCLVIWYV